MSDKRAERLQVMLTQEEVQAVDEWRFQHRMPSRSAAARALMNLGIKASAATAREGPLLNKTVPSGDVGVVGSSDPAVVAALDGDAQRPGVMVLDGDTFIAHGVASFVSDGGFRVIGPARDVEEACALLSSESPAAAVMEPTVTGSAAALESFLARLAGARVPCVFFTAGDPAQLVAPALMDRIPVVLKTSGDPAALIRALAAVIEGRR